MYTGLVGKPEERRLLERPRHRWKDIKKDLKDVEWGSWNGSILLRIGADGGHS